ncbi:hypothetical protein L873DRAFT_1177489 [Choiromyces venosus 120613-1]|uniref:Uncharacterized protein n=1 Tax=Choiromyces venosus 120613-1 TaxID=1336337 RepID=A0A3N4K6N3_9PEZI|nr:hypothetical protein L873DRAFT_1177489 [Choiromyces venosus 120613-1]
MTGETRNCSRVSRQNGTSRQPWLHFSLSLPPRGVGMRGGLLKSAFWHQKLPIAIPSCLLGRPNRPKRTYPTLFFFSFVFFAFFLAREDWESGTLVIGFFVIAGRTLLGHF